MENALTAATAPVEIIVERLNDPRGEDFNALYNIYLHTIAASEQKPRQAIEAMTLNGNYRLFIARSEGKVVGFSINYIADAKDFALLEYIAVAESVQGRGIGSRLFQEGVDLLEKENVRCRVLVEVDSEREEAPDRPMRLRRMRFYRNLGCRRLHGVAYIMPRVGQGTPPQMDLYVFRETGPYVARPELQYWLTTIYQRIYDCAPDDQRIDAMMGGLGNIIPLE